MHRTEGPDGTGADRYTETNPATVINANAMNALQEEIALAVEAAGLTLRATGALDEAGTWGQLREAIGELTAGAMKTITLRFTSADFPADFVDVTCTYMRHSLRKLATLHIPTVQLNLASGVTSIISILQSSGALIPADIRPKGAGGYYPSFVIGYSDGADGVNGNGAFTTFMFEHAASKFRIDRPGGNFSGTVYIPTMNFTFIVA